METRLGSLQDVVTGILERMQTDNIVRRLREKEHTVWRPSPEEISNRLGWLDNPTEMPVQVERLQQLRRTLQDEAYTHVLLLGMGGSSLAPELFAKIFGAQSDGLVLLVLDSTDANQVRQMEQQLDLTRTLFVVATKSGGTVETLSFFKYFYNAVATAVGAENAGRHFVAITDAGSKLVDLATTYQFRATFLNNPNIGGRYSVLSFFGMLPAALVGIDIGALLGRAAAAAESEWDVHAAGVRLGAIMAAAAASGRDKLTLVTSPQIASFADWAEQLIAESTGKDGKGILPVVGEPLGRPEQYGSDRLFVYMHLAGETADVAVTTRKLSALKEAGHPLVVIELPDLLGLGGQFFRWMMATAVAGHLLNIQPFNQPNVESAKVRAREMVAAFHESGQLPVAESEPPQRERLLQFLEQVNPGDYIAIHAYIQPTAAADELLQILQRQLRDRHRVATTIGYGPRFLHSTGQLHKGDGGNGLFVQLTAQAETDLPIPDKAGSPESSMGFDLLKMAQALGDGQALQDEGRRFIRFDCHTTPLDGLRELVGA